MDVLGMNLAAVREKLRDFERVATVLGMSRKERLAILNTTDSCYAALTSGMPATPNAVAPELERRLSYAMPLMRRLASNTVELAPSMVVEERRVVAA